ncbi:hypothetical protein [Nitrosomonas sp. Nm166]|uniref:hypothetical protein n=1 Tax=Nitrosomonas sp. Nm166 TaxID=1881054 RepID=UPI0008E29402|nr:hypothetical protein [Nitrosomonas sp. Nm166]SFD86289.1 hypothetical protein SAMN05428977_100196 [Nitrosomonas sp. Nm166]
MQLIFEKKWATHYEIKEPSSGLTVCHLHYSPYNNQWFSSGHTANITFFEEIHARSPINLRN